MQCSRERVYLKRAETLLAKGRPRTERYSRFEEIFARVAIFAIRGRRGYSLPFVPLRCGDSRSNCGLCLRRIYVLYAYQA